MNFDWMTSINTMFEFIIGIVSIASFLYGGWRLIIRPIKTIFKKIDKIEKTVNCVNDEVLPVIQSLSAEFSKNSGKSIRDRIVRIDDNTRLAELRSKLIASNLITTSIVEFDKTGNMVWANKSFLNLTGLDLEQLRYKGWFIAIEEDERERVWNLWKHSIESNIPFESEFPIKNQITSCIKVVKCTVYPHKSSDLTIENPILGYYGTISEIVN